MLGVWIRGLICIIIIIVVGIGFVFFLFSFSSLVDIEIFTNVMKSFSTAPVFFACKELLNIESVPAATVIVDPRNTKVEVEELETETAVIR